MKIKYLGLAACFALASQATLSNAEPSITEINQPLLGDYPQSTFYQPDLTEKHYSILDNKAIIESDIAVGDHYHVQMYGIENLAIANVNADSGGDMTANAAWSGNTTWPGGVVPYVISSASQVDQSAIFAGMAKIADHSGVQFVPRTNQADYVEIIKGSGCWSYVGRTGGRQEVSIGNGCGYANTVAHELMHAIGFYHEQSRSDRDNYVQINWQNIPDDKEHNFEKHGAVTSTVGSYDPYSIMHYGYTAFSSNGQPTITSLIPGVPSSALGQGNGMTNQDIAAVQAVYGNGGGTAPSNGPLIVYEHCPFDGHAVGIQPIGGQSLSSLIQLGFQDNKMSSFRLAPGFVVRFYQGANLDGASHLATTDDDCLANNGFNDNISSIYLRADGDTGLSGNYHLKNRNSGLYMDVALSGLDDGVNIRQWTFNGSTAQQFNFSHLGNGAYVIRNVNSNKAVDVAAIDHANGANIHQWNYEGLLNQQFVARPVPGTQYYQLIAMHSGKSIKIAGGSTSSGANIEQWQNDNQLSSHWELVPVDGPSGTNIKQEAESYFAMQGVQTEATQDPQGGNLNVGWIDTGDWMAYSNINIPTAGSYTVEYRVASANTGGTLSLDLNGGATVLGSVAIPNTGGWQNWTTISHTVNIPAGTHSVGLFAQTGGWNINWFRVTSN